jgi:hypothetical protein
MHKDIRSIMKKLVKQGWTWDRAGNGHYRAIPNDKTKQMVFISSTPSGHSWLREAIRDLRRSGALI